MEGLIVGEGSIELKALVEEMENSSTFIVLVQNWKEFGELLGIRDVDLLELERKLNMRDIQLKRIPREILKIWKAEKGTSATLKALHDALVDCGGYDIAESLLTRSIPVESLQLATFIWQGNLITVKDLLGDTSSENTFIKIYDELRKQLRPYPIQLIKEQLLPPKLPRYYIPRIMHLPSVELDPKIFNSGITYDHIFLFKDITKSELAKLTSYRGSIMESGDQLHSVTARFILLECDEDFDRICKITAKPVHVIQHQDGHCFWKKSSKQVCIFGQFLKGEGESIDEQKLVSKLESVFPPCNLCIADSPGMGKTYSLATLATNIQQQQPNSIVLFIVLQEFVQQIYLHSSAIEAIAAYSSCDELTKLILTEILNSNSYNLCLFLDGYDEVPQDYKITVDSFLMELKKLNNVNIFITTRPHMKDAVELIFSCFSFEIRPFNKPDQINFLTKYWIQEYGAYETKNLAKFANQVLVALETKLVNREREIAGVPLQCMMLGEVFADDAKRASKFKRRRKFTVEPISFFYMYKRLVELKLSRIQDQASRQHYTKVHFFYSISLLFPDWIGIFKPRLIGQSKINKNTLYSIGLVEISPEQNKPRFIHRTFAEYLLAEFIIQNLATCTACVDLLVGEILGLRGMIKYEVDAEIDQYFLRYPAIVYFIEMHLKEYAKMSSISDMILQLPRYVSTNFTCYDLRNAIGGCSAHDLEFTFDYASKLLHHHRNGEELIGNHFKHLPHILIEKSGNDVMLIKLLEFMKLEFGVGLDYYTLDKWRLYSPPIPKYTIVHTAVREGKYNMVACLVQRYGCQISKLKYLLYACVLESHRNSDEIIQEKLLIIEMLLEINPDWLEEKNPRMCLSIPLLAPDVHFSLLQRLVQHGANIHELSSEGGTLLHSVSKKNYADLVDLALGHGFYDINRKNYKGQTPLMYLIEVIGTVDDELLDKFHKAGANFNTESGESVLFYALKYSDDVNFFKKLIEYGADVHYRDWHGRRQNLLHRVMQPVGKSENRMQILDLLVKINPEWIHERDWDERTPLLQRYAELKLMVRLVEHGANINTYSRQSGTILHYWGEPTTYSELVRWVLSNGFNLINHFDNHHRSPLMHAIHQFETLEDDVLMLFYEAGADFNATDTYRENSVLFYALQTQSFSSNTLHFIRKILDYGANVNFSNHHKETAAHTLFYWPCWDAKQKLSVLKLLQCRGYNLFNQMDTSGRTPLDALHYTLSRKNLMSESQKAAFVDDDLLKFLTDRTEFYLNQN